MKNPRPGLVLLIASLGVWLGGGNGAGEVLASEPFQPAPTLEARALLPASLLKGPKHEVGAAVKGDGFLTSYSVKSEFGTWKAGDREMVEVRVKEVYSLAKLSEVSKSEIFGKALAAAAQDKAKAVAGVVKDPVGTAKAIPGATTRFAKGLARTSKKTYDKVTTEKAVPDDRTSEDKAKDAAAAAGGAAESLLISGKRREWAGKVGADPYTTNEPLAEARRGGVDRLCGRLRPQLCRAQRARAGDDHQRGPRRVRPSSRRAREAEHRQARGGRGLQSHGPEARAQQELHAHPANRADRSGGRPGRRFRQERSRCPRGGSRVGRGRSVHPPVPLQLLAKGAKEAGGFKAFTVSANEIEAVTAGGRLVLPWSVDYMTWNDGTAPDETPPVRGAGAKEMWISGVATERATRELKAQRFAVLEKRPLE